jgi:hypothetical protein
LTNNKLKSGVEYKTEGISCKFTNFNEDYENNLESPSEKKFLLFDTAGKSEPLLIDPEEREKLKDEELKVTVETNYRDLKLSEEFMKNVLIEKSKIIIVVVNQLSLAEQLFLFELKNDRHFSELFVIHNLFYFKRRKEIEEYIERTIINSIYFDLKKEYHFDLDEEDQNTAEMPYYFTEELEKNGKRSIISHLILGDIETEDDWIKNCNDKTIDFLKTKMQVVPQTEFFDIESILQKGLTNENIIDENSKLTDNQNDNTLDNKITGTLMLENDGKNKEIKEAENIPEMVDFNLMGYTPDFIFYKDEKDEKNAKFVIEVECAGEEDKNISITAKQRKAKVFFHIEGKKIFPKELHDIKPKPFSINFAVNTEKEGIKIDTSEEVNKTKPTYNEGIYRKIFPMTKKEKQNLIFK